VNGAEHYRDAEQFAEASVYAYQKWGEYGDPAELKAAKWQQAQGQLHATLATAAAFLAVAVIRPDDRYEWDRAMGIAGDAAEVTR
jgi:hypothetical protein